MASKRPIDVKRDSAVAGTVGSKDDGTPIMEMFTLNDNLLVITKKAVYEVKLADQVDPERENPSIPQSVQRRILDLGTDSELVGRTLLTAKKLFREEFLPSSIDLKRALILSFDILTNMVVMHATATEYELVEKKEVQAVQRRDQSNGSFAIPSISDVKTRCQTFFQKADHAEHTIWDLVTLFYPDIGPKCKFESLRDLAGDRYGSDDDFTEFMRQALPFLKMVRNTRDCLDHRNAKGVVITDFALRKDGVIDLPAIQIRFRDTSQPPVSLSTYMPLVVERMLDVVEHLMAFLCSKQVQAFAGFPIQIGMISEDRRRNRYVRYGYVTNIHGDWTPIE